MKYLKISNQGIMVIDNLIDIASSTKRFKYIIDDRNLSKIKKDSVIPNDKILKLKNNLLNHCFLTNVEFESALSEFLHSSYFTILKKYLRNRNIGTFGTGLKQAYCYFLRENINFRVFSDLQEFKIYKAKKLSAGIYSDFVTIDGKVTNLNVAYAMGDYNLGMSISEIWTNAIDEGSEILKIVDEKDIEGEIGKTCFYLEYNDNVKTFHESWNEYFAFNRTDCIYKDGETDISGIQIFGKEDGVPFDKMIVYRRQIKVFEYNRPSIYHYNIDDLEITGSRVIKNSGDMDDKIYTVLAQKVPKEVIKGLIKGFTKYKHTYESMITWDSWMGSLSKHWKEAIGDAQIVETDKINLYKEQVIEKEKTHTIYELPSALTTSLIKKDYGNHVNGAFSSNGREGIILDEKEYSQDHIDFIYYIRDMCELFIPCKNYTSIGIYESSSSNIIISYEKEIFINWSIINAYTTKELLVKINIQNQLLKKYEDYSAVCNRSVDIELSETVLNIHNNDFKFLNELSKGSLCYSTNYGYWFIIDNEDGQKTMCISFNFLEKHMSPLLSLTPIDKESFETRLLDTDFKYSHSKIIPTEISKLNYFIVEEKIQIQN